MESQQEELLNKLNQRMRSKYNTIKKVYSQALRKYVIFNAKGFHHLHYKPGGTSRTTSEKIHKLQLLPLAIPVIKNAGSIYEERAITIRLGRKKKSSIGRAIQYALVADVGTKRKISVRVIILEIQNAAPIFWSIMKH